MQLNLFRRLVAVIAVASTALALTVAPAAATDPSAEVRLPDGRVLPEIPADLLQPGVHAQMLADNEAVALSFSAGAATTGDEPVGIGAPSKEVTVRSEAVGTAAFSGPAGPLPNGLRREVLGFLPYWMLDPESLASLRYDLVSTVAYFGIGVQSNGYLNRGPTGSRTVGWTAWNSSAMSEVLTRAHARGVRVVPTITMMAWSGDYSEMSTLLNSSTFRARLVVDVATIIRERGADGVNVDFEPVPTSLRGQFTSFIRQLKQGLVAAGVRSYVTVDTMAGAGTWATGYDIAALSAPGAADALMVMAYDFSWRGSARAGGVAPMESPYIFDATDALEDHLALVDPRKVIWGVPYYGRTWPTQTDQLNSLTCRVSDPPTCPESKVTAPSASVAYYYGGAIKHAAEYGRRWDAAGQVPWYAWYDETNTTWRQGYYDDPQSLRAKYDLVGRHGLAGIGIWSLLMDAGSDDLDNLLLDRFVKLDFRLAGADRYATAAAVSAWHFAPGVPVAYVATGANYPDALAGAPAAARAGGPVLLVSAEAIPAATAAELSRLRPGRIVVLGGAGVVSEAVASALAAYTSGEVSRLAGADRYATAAAVSAAHFAPGVAVAYVATGANYPDALAGGAAAARAGGGPVLLVQTDAIPAATAAELTRLAPQRIVVLGGAGVVSEAVAAALADYTSGEVSRLAGADRYETAVAVNAAGFGPDSPATVFVATGAAFPDALAAAGVAGRSNAPLLLVGRNALPAVVAAELVRLNPSTVVVLGGSGAVSSGVVSAIRALWP